MGYKLIIIESDSRDDYKKNKILKPHDLKVTQYLYENDRENIYWKLPNIDQDMNKETIIKNLLDTILSKRIIDYKDDKFHQIVGYNWYDNIIVKYNSDFTVNNRKNIDYRRKIRYNTIYNIYSKLYNIFEDNSKEESEKIQKKQITDLIAKGDIVYIIDIKYRVEKIDSKKIKDKNKFCKYHRIMLDTLLGMNKKTYIRYDKNTKKFIERNCQMPYQIREEEGRLGECLGESLEEPLGLGDPSGLGDP